MSKIDEKKAEPVNIETSVIEEAKSSSAQDTKSIIIKCTAAAVAAALLIYSFSSCLGKFSDANNAIAESAGKPVSQQTSGTAGDEDLFSDTFSDTDSIEEPSADENEDSDTDVSDSSDDEAPQTNSGSASDKTVKADKKPAANKKPQTKEEIVAYYNTAINKVKQNSKSITITKDESYQSGGIDLASLGAFESMINSLIKSFMGPNKEKVGKVLSTAGEKTALFPVEGESWASKLTAADIKEAKCTEKDGVYTIGLKILDDDFSATVTHGSNHHTRAFSTVLAKDINDNAGAAKTFLSGLKIGYKNGTIICRVDVKTGNVLSVSYDYAWIMHVDSFGGVDAPFGGRQSFDIKW